MKDDVLGAVLKVCLNAKNTKKPQGLQSLYRRHCFRCALRENSLRPLRLKNVSFKTASHLRKVSKIFGKVAERFSEILFMPENILFMPKNVVEILPKVDFVLKNFPQLSFWHFGMFPKYLTVSFRRYAIPPKVFNTAILALLRISEVLDNV
jgi:hypothetical protein